MARHEGVAVTAASDARRVWVRDGFLAVLAANVGGVASIATVVFGLGGPGNLIDPLFFALAGIAVVAPVVLGPPSGLLIHTVWTRLPEHRWVALFLGGPIGAAVGLAQFGALRPFIRANGDVEVFFLIGVMAGTLVGTFGVPAYLALAHQERPAWPALIVFPVVAMVAVLIPIGVGVMWLD